MEIGYRKLKFQDIENVVFNGQKITLHEKSHQIIKEQYEQAQKLSKKQQPIYGLNTGFGGLSETKIPASQQEILQTNIILSHAVGVGEPLDYYSARALVFFRLNTLLQGYSLASPQLIDILTRLLNLGYSPVIPKKGSVGASGDLAPLAHLGLLLLGRGEAILNGAKVKASTIMDSLPKFSLGIRDGLALINGTQAMCAVGFTALRESLYLLKLSTIATALTMEAIGGHLDAFSPKIHKLKPYPGQLWVARKVRTLLKGSKRKTAVSNLNVQDPYSIRCAPQVLGACWDITQRNLAILELEINSVTDNPLFFANKNGGFKVLSGGNFHGEQMAFSLDHQAMAVSEVANISERRMELLVNKNYSNGLPAFLTPNPGLNSGFMMIHVTASSLVNDNKILSHPASTDSISTSAGREDHVSMGMTSANKLNEIVKNSKIVVLMEIMAALQAIDLRQPGYLAPKTKEFYQEARKIIAFRPEDGPFMEDFHNLSLWIEETTTRNWVKSLLGNGEV